MGLGPMVWRSEDLGETFVNTEMIGTASGNENHYLVTQRPGHEFEVYKLVIDPTYVEVVECDNLNGYNLYTSNGGTGFINAAGQFESANVSSIWSHDCIKFKGDGQIHGFTPG
ncbi:unnamed protein product [Ilex paraguariensis]|uniref:Glycosyl hydrolase n=1 Tax=Ilex paraguariensis TaxID=185542 RepID=A0ABC8UWY4_9AQUA